MKIPTQFPSLTLLSNQPGMQEIMNILHKKGQEDATIEFDGDIRITPFNMKEELEERFFAKVGAYLFREGKEIKDQWLDDIDWIKIDKTIESIKRKLEDEEDSEEEDESPEYNILDPNELEGQEDATVEFDGDIRITPFNMKEELEEGYFDKEGTYIFQKEKEIKDQWLDDIDWIKVNKSVESIKRILEDEEDSEEEDESPEYNIPYQFVVIGQEDATIDFDGDIRITPFNMKEELEEGYLDENGFYILRKDITDPWLDSIDWIKVNKAAKSIKRKLEDEEDSDEDEKPPIDLVVKYKQMLELMKPGESVQKAICRLGGSKSSKSANSRWKKKKESDSMDTNEGSGKDVEKLLLLIGLADEIVHSGDTDIYQQIYEKMLFYVNCKSKTSANGSLNTDAELDMFGDDFEEKVDEYKVAMPPPQTLLPVLRNNYIF